MLKIYAPMPPRHQTQEATVSHTTTLAIQMRWPTADLHNHMVHGSAYKQVAKRLMGVVRCQPFLGHFYHTRPRKPAEKPQEGPCAGLRVRLLQESKHGHSRLDTHLGRPDPNRSLGRVVGL